MKASDAWIYALVGALVIWWLVAGGPAVVDLGPNATVGGKGVDTRYRSPLEVPPYQSPDGVTDVVDLPPVSLDAWLANI